jgi:hypothetical protein
METAPTFANRWLLIDDLSVCATIARRGDKMAFKHGSASRDRDEGEEFTRGEEDLHHIENRKDSGGMSMKMMHGKEMKNAAHHTGRSVAEHKEPHEEM